MEIHSRKLLTIITEAVLEGPLLRDLERIGARGYTVTDARGKGVRGVRPAGFELNSSIRVEVICDEPMARTIAAHMKEAYYEDYAMSLFLVDVGVFRPEKF